MRDRRRYLMVARRLDALVFACCFGLVPMAWAGDRALVGAGTAKCARYLESASKGFDSSLNLVASWTQGYISGVNVGRMNAKLPALVLPDLAEIRTWHERYCKQHPDDLVYESSDSLIESLQAH